MLYLSGTSTFASLFMVQLAPSSAPVQLASNNVQSYSGSFSADKSAAYFTDAVSSATFATTVTGCPGNNTSCGCAHGGTCTSLGVIDALQFAADNSMMVFRAGLAAQTCTSPFLSGDNPCYNTGSLFSAHENGTGFAAAPPTQIDTSVYSGRVQLGEPSPSTPAQKTLVWEQVVTVPGFGLSRELKTRNADGSGPARVIQGIADPAGGYGLNYDVIESHVLATPTGPVLVWIAAVPTVPSCTSACAYVRELFTSNLDGSNPHRLDTVVSNLQAITANNVSAGTTPMAVWQATHLICPLFCFTENFLMSAVLGGATVPVTTIQATTDTITYQFSPSQKFVVFQQSNTNPNGTSLWDAQLSPRPGRSNSPRSWAPSCSSSCRGTPPPWSTS